MTERIGSAVIGLLALFLATRHALAGESDGPRNGSAAAAVTRRARIKPTLVDLGAGAARQFYAVLEAGRLTGARVADSTRWFVNGIPGGNRAVGTITKDGLFKAPSTSPGSSEIHISAEVREASNHHLWATVLLDGKRPEYKTVSQWSEAVDHLEHFMEPQALALEKSGNILIADGKIKRFSPEGAFVNEFGRTLGDVENSLVGPLNIAVDDHGHIFVSDLRTGPPRIQAFDADGTYLHGFGPKGVGPGNVMDTRGMVLSSKGRLYIGDIDNMRVNVYQHSGEFVQAIGRKGVMPGQFNVPYGLALDANDDLFVVSHFGPCQKLTPDGHSIHAFAYPDPPAGAIHFLDVASDRWGNVYLIVKGAMTPEGDYQPVVDAEGNRIDIVKYNNYGDFIANLRLSSTDHDPTRLVVDDSDRVLVLFTGEKRIGVEVLMQ